MLRQIDSQSDTRKTEPQKDYGVLNRFLPKSNRKATR